MEKLETCALLVGLLSGVAAVETNLVVPQKIKHRTTMLLLSHFSRVQLCVTP